MLQGSRSCLDVQLSFGLLGTLQVFAAADDLPNRMQGTYMHIMHTWGLLLLVLHMRCRCCEKHRALLCWVGFMQLYALRMCVYVCLLHIPACHCTHSSKQKGVWEEATICLACPCLGVETT